MLELRGKFTSGMRLLENLGEKVATKQAFLMVSILRSKASPNLQIIPKRHLTKKLSDLQETAEKALKSYDPFAPEKLVPILAKGYKQAYDAEWSTRNPDSKVMLRQKQSEFAKALQMASGVVVDALADTDTLVAGNPTNIAVRVFAPENANVKISECKFENPE